MWFLFILTTFAGSHRPLCEKVADADLVFEIQFQQVAVYPPEAKDKKWAPPMSELEKTLSTGIVQRVFKGAISPGEPRSTSWEIRLSPGGSSVAAWERFLAKPTFSQIVFLKKDGHRLVTTGWAEESAPCSSSHHRSWCTQYSDFQQQIVTCLSSTSKD